MSFELNANKCNKEEEEVMIPDNDSTQNLLQTLENQNTQTLSCEFCTKQEQKVVLTAQHCLINHGFLQCSHLRFWWRAQSTILLQILVQPSLSGRFSSGSPIISIQSYRSEKLLSLKANAKSAYVEADTLPLVNSNSIPVLSLEFHFVWLLRKSE